EDGIRDFHVTGVQTCALPISMARIHVPVHIRWNDLDAYGHVNNAAMLTLLEEARISVFWSRGDVGPGEPPGTAVLDARPGSATADRKSGVEGEAVGTGEPVRP